MDYKVVVTAEAEEDLNQFIQYLLFAKKNEQAAKNVLLTTVKNALSVSLYEGIIFLSYFKEKRIKKVSAKYCYVTHELRLHQNDRCKRFTLF